MTKVPLSTLYGVPADKAGRMQPLTSTIKHRFTMPTTTKASKTALAKKNAEAEKAKKKALREGKNKLAAPAGKPGKKGASLINQSKTKKK